jgi:tRNA uracil 4-sulfurtransferase
MKRKKVVVLLSSGIDSPVSSYKMIKAGYSVVLVHFHNLTPSSEHVKQNIIDMRDQLQKYQKKIKLYMVPFGGLQRELIKTVPGQKRMIVYRRFMFRIAEMIAKKEKAVGLVTGDSLAQVASQTLDNLQVVYSVTDLDVFHPLIGKDKKEITKTAEKIGTYDISIRPGDDCCSFLLADYPETRAILADIENIESKSDSDELVKSAFSESETI